METNMIRKTKYSIFLILFILLVSCESTRVAERVGVLAEKQDWMLWRSLNNECQRVFSDKSQCTAEDSMESVYWKRYRVMEETYIEKWGVEP